jgi:predicted transcriptional regulator
MDMLEAVHEHLNSKGRLMRGIANATGVGYFTIARIKAGKGCPCYDVVRKLYDHITKKADNDQPNQA